MASPNIVLDSVRQAAIRAEARFAALRALKATFKAWSAETKKSQKELAKILNADPAHVSRVLAGDKRTMTIETLFLFARAMGRRPRLEMEALDTLAAKKPNYDARPDFALPPTSGVRFFRSTSSATFRDPLERPPKRENSTDTTGGASSLVVS
jgi:transcriptional regulator with XRE-family HTH domain